MKINGLLQQDAARTLTAWQQSFKRHNKLYRYTLSLLLKCIRKLRNRAFKTRFYNSRSFSNDKGSKSEREMYHFYAFQVGNNIARIEVCLLEPVP